METVQFGPNEKMTFTEPLDTWLSAGLRDFAVPEAVGSSARVFSLNYAPLNGDYANFPVAKVMRPDKTRYALPLFENEIRILNTMQDAPGITPMLGLAFLKVSEGQWPAEVAPLTTSLAEEASATQITGTADVYSPEDAEPFLSELNNRVCRRLVGCDHAAPERWEDNLYLRCDGGLHPRRVPPQFPGYSSPQSSQTNCRYYDIRP